MSIALGSVILTVRHQTVKLARQERGLVESTYLASREAELRAYVKLAQSSIAPLVKDAPTPARQAEAMAILARLEYGKDGYFFVYDMDGNNLMHPRQPDLVGRNLRDMKDPFGDSPIQNLLAATRRGGGIVRYYWQKPSSNQVAFKLGYVEPVLAWGWMLGTGLYLDDIEQSLKSIDAQAQANIRETQVRMYSIAIVSIILIGLAGLALNISDNKESGAKLRHLAQRVVHSQEEERVRVARELHDGIVQVLVSSKFFLETAQLQLENKLASPEGPGGHQQIASALKRGLERLNEALAEVRRISHGLRPALLDDFGLGPAIEMLAQEVQEHCSFTIRFASSGKPCALPLSHSTALFRISQEALTNARLHSGAASVLVELTYHRRRIGLSITDDGKGFDLRQIQTDHRSGIGLRNMRERMEGLGGTLKIFSNAQGTQVHASLKTSPQLPSLGNNDYARDDSPHSGG
ncbi:MAG: integral rane sensor signal transduction histidine kinase [Polaromonas sp.]|nr:integral rane sensor signal transduction histidine kinase [Polaromonas sp.]